MATHVQAVTMEGPSRLRGDTRDVVEYVVFERHLALRGRGRWLVCGKITPPTQGMATQAQQERASATAA